MGGADVWGGNAWAAPEAPKKSPEVAKPAPMGGANDFGWGGGGGGGNALAGQPIVLGSSGGFAPAPKVAADEEFGGWTSSTGPTPSGTGAKPASGFGGSEDLFSNVWE